MEPLPSKSPPRGSVPIKAVVFDTFGTVCDFYSAFKRGFTQLAEARGLDCDPGELAIAWRTAYLLATVSQAFTSSTFRPLWDINRDNLLQLVGERYDIELTERETHDMVTLWRTMDPWPDVVAGLNAIKDSAIVGPLSNGNFADMALLARHAALPWDVILGSSLSRQYKPHPDTYLASAAALGLPPEQVCMVAAHQLDLAFAAGHGMQTAFVPRPMEFGGPVKPAVVEPGERHLGAAEVHVEGDWTYVAQDFIDLAAQIRS